MGKKKSMKSNYRKGKRTTKSLSAEQAGLVNNPGQRKPTVKTDLLMVQGSGKLRYEVLSDQSVVLDHARASRYIDLPIFPGERKVSDTQVQLLYDEMRKGTFNELLVILSTAVFNGVEYKINGQHTCWAIEFMPEAFSLNVREIKYKVESQQQLKLLYSTYDRLKARTDGHCTTVLLVGTPVMDGINTSLITKLTAGLKFWHFEHECDRRRITPEQINAIIQNELPQLWRRTALELQEYYLEQKHVARFPVIAAMFATFDKVPTVAPDFWTPVASGIGLEKKTDPRLKLRDMLMQSALTATQTGKDHVPPEQMYRMCLQAWNRWRRGENVQVLRTTKERQKPV
jgi:hypothetical protein